MPAGNRAFWQAKLGRNQARDRLVTRTLRRLGWRVLRFWEHDLRSPARILRRLAAAGEFIPSRRQSPASDRQLIASGT